MVIASYYVLFAAMSGSVHAVLVESVAMTMFAIASTSDIARDRLPLPPMRARGVSPDVRR